MSDDIKAPDHDKRPRTDCALYRGDLPCAIKRVCWDCDEFRPIGKRALIIKFGAPGDALRTTPLLARLRREGYNEITWICDAASQEVLTLAPSIDRLVIHDVGGLPLVMTETFDTVFSLDKDPVARSLARLAQSADKRGFTSSAAGRLETFNTQSDYALRLGMDDELKFHGNTMTVPALLFAMCGYEYAREPYELVLENSALETATTPRSISTDTQPMIALNIGCGARWPTKSWPDAQWIELAKNLAREGFLPVFLGGEAERELLANFGARAGMRALPPAPVRIFAETLRHAACVVTADSLGLHIALALNRPVIGLFCSTADREIEWFGNGEALRGSGGPCYNAHCPNWPGCMNAISPGAVLDLVRARIAARP